MCKTRQKWSSGRNPGLFLVIEVLLCMLYTDQKGPKHSVFSHIYFVFLLFRCFYLSSRGLKLMKNSQVCG